MGHRWLTFLMIVQTCLVAGQTPAYLHYSVQDGLPGNYVYSGLQDNQGLIWFGTDEGLACFDGSRFRIYNMADGLPDSEVLNLQQDSEGRIWVSCFQQKLCYLRGGQVITEKEDSVLAKIQFTTGAYVLSEQIGKGIWFSEASRTVYFVDGKRVRQEEFPYWIVSLHQVGNAFLTMCREAIIYVHDDGNVEELITFKMNSEHPSIAISGNRILYAFPSKSLLFEWKDGRVRKVDEQDKLGGQAFTDHLGRFWVSSPAISAVLFDNKKGDLSNPVTYLPGKKVNRVFEDQQHNLWFCTINEGVYMLPQNAATIFRHERGFPSLNIQALAHDANGRLLVGDDGGNIHILQGHNFRSVHVSAVDGFNLIRHIIPDETHKANWVATDEGLFECSGSFNKIHKYNQASLKSLLVQHDYLWYATSTTLSRMDWKSRNIETFIDRRFTTLGADSDGNIWAGSIGGLYSQKDSFQLDWGNRFPQLKNRIIAIETNEPGKIWVVTPKDGLLSLHVHSGAVTSVETINQKLDIPITNIESLFREPSGKLWMATNKGVVGLDPRNWNVTRFNSFDGIADDDVNSVLVQGDTLWAGTVSGLTRLVLKTPSEESEFKSLITTLQYQMNSQNITCFLIDSLPGHHTIQIPAGTTNLQLQLAGLDFRSRGNLDFEIVRCEDLLPFQWWTFGNLFAWVSSGFKGHADTSLNESATLNLGTFLPPGKYLMQVTAIKASDIHSSQPDQWVLLKLPYWYETMWFYLGLWVLVVYGVWRIYKTRLAFREVHANAAILQLQALQAQMNPHFIGNAVNAIQQFMHPPNPEKTSEYIAMFIGLLRRTMHFSERTFVTFEEELDYIREYLKLVQLRFEDRFEYTITGVEQIPPTTLIPSMLLQPILENATMHGIATQGKSLLELGFDLENDRFCCSLMDNGIGYLEAQRRKKESNRTGRDSKGLHMLQQKVKSLNQLYNLEMSLEVLDRSTLPGNASGTRVTLCYALHKIPKTTN